MWKTSSRHGSAYVSKRSWKRERPHDFMNRADTYRGGVPNHFLNNPSWNMTEPHDEPGERYESHRYRKTFPSEHCSRHVSRPRFMEEQHEEEPAERRGPLGYGYGRSPNFHRHRRESDYQQKETGKGKFQYQRDVWYPRKVNGNHRIYPQRNVPARDIKLQDNTIRRIDRVPYNICSNRQPSFVRNDRPSSLFKIQIKEDGNNGIESKPIKSPCSDISAVSMDLGTDEDDVFNSKKADSTVTEPKASSQADQKQRDEKDCTPCINNNKTAQLEETAEKDCTPCINDNKKAIEKEETAIKIRRANDDNNNVSLIDDGSKGIESSTSSTKKSIPDKNKVLEKSPIGSPPYSADHTTNEKASSSSEPATRDPRLRKKSEVAEIPKDEKNLEKSEDNTAKTETLLDPRCHPKEDKPSRLPPLELKLPRFWARFKASRMKSGSSKKRTEGKISKARRINIKSKPDVCVRNHKVFEKYKKDNLDDIENYCCHVNIQENECNRGPFQELSDISFKSLIDTSKSYLKLKEQKETKPASQTKQASQTKPASQMKHTEKKKQEVKTTLVNEIVGKHATKERSTCSVQKFISLPKDAKNKLPPVGEEKKLGVEEPTPRKIEMLNKTKKRIAPQKGLNTTRSEVENCGKMDKVTGLKRKILDPPSNSIKMRKVHLDKPSSTKKVRPAISKVPRPSEDKKKVRGSSTNEISLPTSVNKSTSQNSHHVKSKIIAVNPPKDRSLPMIIGEDMDCEAASEYSISAEGASKHSRQKSRASTPCQDETNTDKEYSLHVPEASVDGPDELMKALDESIDCINASIFSSKLKGHLEKIANSNVEQTGGNNLTVGPTGSPRSNDLLLEKAGEPVEKLNESTSSSFDESEGISDKEVGGLLEDDEDELLLLVRVIRNPEVKVEVDEEATNSDMFGDQPEVKTEDTDSASGEAEIEKGGSEETVNNINDVLIHEDTLAVPSTNKQSEQEIFDSRVTPNTLGGRGETNQVLNTDITTNSLGSPNRSGISHEGNCARFPSPSGPKTLEEEQSRPVAQTNTTNEMRKSIALSDGPAATSNIVPQNSTEHIGNGVGKNTEAPTWFPPNEANINAVREQTSTMPAVSSTGLKDNVPNIIIQGNTVGDRVSHTSRSESVSMPMKRLLPQMLNMTSKKNQSAQGIRVDFAHRVIRMMNAYIFAIHHFNCLALDLESLDKQYNLEVDIGHLNVSKLRVRMLYGDILLDNLRTLPPSVRSREIFVMYFLEFLINMIPDFEEKSLMTNLVWDLITVHIKEYEENDTLRCFKSYTGKDLMIQQNLGVRMSKQQYVILRKQVFYYLRSLQFRVPERSDESQRPIATETSAPQNFVKLNITNKVPVDVANNPKPQNNALKNFAKLYERYNYEGQKAEKRAESVLGVHPNLRGSNVNTMNIRPNSQGRSVVNANPNLQGLNCNTSVGSCMNSQGSHVVPVHTNLQGSNINTSVGNVMNMRPNLQSVGNLHSNLQSPNVNALTRNAMNIRPYLQGPSVANVHSNLLNPNVNTTTRNVINIRPDLQGPIFGNVNQNLQSPNANTSTRNAMNQGPSVVNVYPNLQGPNANTSTRNAIYIRPNLQGPSAVNIYPNLQGPSFANVHPNIQSPNANNSTRNTMNILSNLLGSNVNTSVGNPMLPNSQGQNALNLTESNSYSSLGNATNIAYTYSSFGRIMNTRSNFQESNACCMDAMGSHSNLQGSNTTSINSHSLVPNAQIAMSICQNSQQSQNASYQKLFHHIPKSSAQKHSLETPNQCEDCYTPSQKKPKNQMAGQKCNNTRVIDANNTIVSSNADLMPAERDMTTSRISPNNPQNQYNMLQANMKEKRLESYVASGYESSLLHPGYGSPTRPASPYAGYRATPPSCNSASSQVTVPVCYSGTSCGTPPVCTSDVLYPTPPMSNSASSYAASPTPTSEAPSANVTESQTNFTPADVKNVQLNSESKPFAPSNILEPVVSVRLKDEPDEIIDLTWLEDEFIKEEVTDSEYNNPEEESLLILDNRKCVCGKVAEYLCSCNTAMYCSRECQCEDWMNHQPVCSSVISTAPGVPDEN